MEYFSVFNLKDKIRVGDYIGKEDTWLSKVHSVDEEGFTYLRDDQQERLTRVEFKRDASSCYAWIPAIAIELLNQFLVQLYEQRAYQSILTDKLKTIDRLDNEVLKLKDKLKEAGQNS